MKSAKEETHENHEVKAWLIGAWHLFNTYLRAVAQEYLDLTVPDGRVGWPVPTSSPLTTPSSQYLATHDSVTCLKYPLGKYGESVVARRVSYRNDLVVAKPRSVIGHSSKGTGKLNNGLRAALGCQAIGQP